MPKVKKPRALNKPIRYDKYIEDKRKVENVSKIDTEYFSKLQIFVQAHQSPPKVTVAELLQQLTVTQAELENIKVRCDLFIIYDSESVLR